VQIGDLKLSKELKEKLLGSDRKELGLGIRIADLNLTPCEIKNVRNVLQVNRSTHRFTEWNFWYDVTYSAWRPWQCCHLVIAHATSARRLCCSVRQFALARALRTQL